MELVHKIFGHRSVTHYLITNVFITSILVVVFWVSGIHLIYALTFFLGYLTHLLGEAATTNGLTLFKPFYKKPVYSLPKKFRIKMGKSISSQELFIIGVFTIIFFVYVY